MGRLNHNRLNSCSLVVSLTWSSCPQTMWEGTVIRGAVRSNSVAFSSSAKPFNTVFRKFIRRLHRLHIACLIIKLVTIHVLAQKIKSATYIVSISKHDIRGLKCTCINPGLVIYMLFLYILHDLVLVVERNICTRDTYTLNKIHDIVSSCPLLLEGSKNGINHGHSLPVKSPCITSCSIPIASLIFIQQKYNS